MAISIYNGTPDQVLTGHATAEPMTRNLDDAQPFADGHVTASHQAHRAEEPGMYDTDLAVSVEPVTFGPRHERDVRHGRVAIQDVNIQFI